MKTQVNDRLEWTTGRRSIDDVLSTEDAVDGIHLVRVGGVAMETQLRGILLEPVHGVVLRPLKGTTNRAFLLRGERLVQEGHKQVLKRGINTDEFVVGKTAI